MKRNWIILLFTLSLFGLAACNTIEGAGKDIEATGDTIKDEAHDAKH